MKLHVLGSGSCMVIQERTPSSYILETENANIMIDTGTGSTQNLRKSKFSTEDLDAVINTHRHPDHVSDLVPIIQDKVVRSFDREEPDIQLLGPEGHRKYLENRMQAEMAAYPEAVEENFGFGLKIDSLEEVSNVCGLEVDGIEAEHGSEEFKCLSIRISDSDKSIVFTGDTDYFDELKNFAEGADAIVTDCSKPDDMKAEGHMTPTECAKVAERADIDMLVLSHLYPEAERADIESTAAETFPGDIKVAEDLMTLDF